MSQYAANQMWLAMSHHQASQAAAAQDPANFGHFALHAAAAGAHPAAMSGAYDHGMHHHGFLPNGYGKTASAYMSAPSTFHFNQRNKEGERAAAAAAGVFAAPPPPHAITSHGASGHAENMASGMSSRMPAGPAGSLFTQQLAANPWRHQNLMAAQQCLNSHSSPFGVLPHQTVNVMTMGHAGSADQHGVHYGSSNAAMNHKSWLVEANKHAQQHHQKSTSNAAQNAAASFNNAMLAAQGVHHSRQQVAHPFDPLAAAAAGKHAQQQHAAYQQAAQRQQNAEASYLAAAMRQEAEHYRYANAVNNPLMSMMENGTGRTTHPHQQYSTLGFGATRTSSTRDVAEHSHAQHSSKHSSSNSSNSHSSNHARQHSHGASSVATASSATHHQPQQHFGANCAMPVPGSGGTVNNFNNVNAFSPGHASNGGHNHNGNNSRSSSVASNHAAAGASNNNVPNQHGGSESSSCSFGYNSPSSAIPPHSPYSGRGVGAAGHNHPSSHTPTPTAAMPGTPVAPDNGYGSSASNYGPSTPVNQVAPGGYPLAGSAPATPTPTPGGYPTPPASVTQASQQSQHSSVGGHDDAHGMHYSSNAAAVVPNGYASNFAANFSGQKIPQQQVPNASSCMLATSTNGAGARAYHTGLSAAISEPDTSQCIPGMGMGAIPSSKHTGAVSICGGQADPNLGQVFTEQEIDFPSINFPADDPASSFMRLDGANSAGHKKKRDKSKPKKKKDKSKQVVQQQQQQQPQPMVNNFMNYHHSQFQNNPNFHDTYAGHVNQLQASCNAFMQQQMQQQSQMDSQQTMPVDSGCYSHLQNEMLNHSQQLSAQQVQNDQQSHVQQLSCDKSHAMHHVPASHTSELAAMSSSMQQLEHAPSHPVTTVDEKTLESLEDDLKFLEATTQSCSASTDTDTSHNTSGQRLSTDEVVPPPPAADDYRPCLTPTEPLLNDALNDEVRSDSSEEQKTAEQNGSNLNFLNYMPNVENELVPLTASTASNNNSHQHNCDSADASKPDNIRLEEATTDGQVIKKKKKKNKEGKKSCSTGSETITKQFSKPDTATTKDSATEYSFEESSKTNFSSNFSSEACKKNSDSRFFKTKSNSSSSSNDGFLKKSEKSKNKRKLEPEVPHDEYEFHDFSPTTAKKSKKSSTKKDKIAPISSSAVAMKKNGAVSKSLTKTETQTSIKTPSSISKACDNSANSMKLSNKVSSNQQSSSHKTPNHHVHKPAKIAPKPPAPASLPAIVTIVNQVNSHEQPMAKVKMSSPGVVAPMQTSNGANKKALMVSNKKDSKESPAKQSVTVGTGTQSMGTNTPRRRSQDKKALTIREGLMRTGDFVVAMDEMNTELPMIWRIEGKSLLQRFEPSDQDGIIVYTNTSSYSAWNPTVRQRYTGVDVRIMGCSRTKITVEKLGLTKASPSTITSSFNGDIPQIERKPVPLGYQHQENFEVFIQTLISQALDPNFIAEIVKENDDYFLTHVQAIDEFCARKKAKFFSRVKWDAAVVKCVETFPTFTITPQSNVGDLRCKLCHDNWSSAILNFVGEPYDTMTLEVKDMSIPEIKQTKYAACDVCKEKILLFSRLHHQKNNFYLKCKEKVEEMRAGDENKESHLILEQCLQDNDWIQILFHELEEIWFACDKLR